mmetsp:Transcript_928/g.1523  ORF Transcript_928/g.1523 Transcript_928/m.1523 type:complete len:525 (+) Transcript_928:18-1592(+)
MSSAPISRISFSNRNTSCDESEPQSSPLHPHLERKTTLSPNPRTSRVLSRGSIYGGRISYLEPRKASVAYRGSVMVAIAREADSIKQELQQGFIGNRVFHISWAVYFVVLSLIGGFILCTSDDTSFVDSLFDSTSCAVNSGLTAVSVAERSKASFVWMAILMLLGSGPILLLPTILFRCYKLKKHIPKMQSALASLETPDSSKLVILDHLLLYDASMVSAVVILLYVLLFLLLGTLTLTLAYQLYDMEPALRDRGFTFFQIALFTAVSAFTNSGILLSPDSLSYYTNNAAVLIILSIIITGGNVLLPVLLGQLCQCVRWMSRHVLGPAHRWTNALDYVLLNPRLITTHMYFHGENMYLFQFFLLSNTLMTIFFACVSANREKMMQYGSNSEVALLGLFQIINARHSGFAVFNFRDLGSDVLFMYALAMFLVPVPYIGVLRATSQTAKVDESEMLLVTVMKKIVFRVWFLRLLVILALVVCENHTIEDNQEDVQLWYIIFEVISAYSKYSFAPTHISGKNLLLCL